MYTSGTTGRPKGVTLSHHNMLAVVAGALLNKMVARKVTDKLGGNMRAAVSGGASLSGEVSQLFIALGLPIIQGYGLTETSPIVSLDPLEASSLEDKRIHKAVVLKIKAALKDFPGYAKIRRVNLSLTPWAIEEGLATPIMKVKRPKVLEHFSAEVEAMYSGDSNE